MYTTQILTERLKAAIKKSGKTQKDILANSGANENALNQLSDKKGISSFTLAKISDEVDCSVDYLLGRTNNPQSHKLSNSVLTGDISLSNNSVVGDGQVGVMIHNATDCDKQIADLVKAFSKLDTFGRAEVLVFIKNLNKEKTAWVEEG